MSTILNNKDDFEWYKTGLDYAAKERHNHIGEPTQYPCKVKSIYDPDPNGCVIRASCPYFTHYFQYKEDRTCESCSHKTREWSNKWSDDDET
jgi:hypothetical protein